MIEQLSGHSATPSYCPFCGGVAETEDHVPSRGFLDNIPVDGWRTIPCCRKCNNAFSFDEEYAYCAIECYVCNTLSIDKIERDKVKKILNHAPKILYGIQSLNEENEGSIKVDWGRIENVVRKNLIGHAYYELGDAVDEIAEFWVKPIDDMSQDELSEFLKTEYCNVSASIGSRLSQSHFIVTLDGQYWGTINLWKEIAEHRYKYFVSVDTKTVKVLIRDRIAGYMRFN